MRPRSTCDAAERQLVSPRRSPQMTSTTIVVDRHKGARAALQSFRTRALIAFAAAAGLLGPPEFLRAQEPPAFGVCIPRSQRSGHDVGCFIITDQRLGTLGSAPMFWHISRFSSKRQADAARGTNASSTVIDAFGATWLLTIADRNWRSTAGNSVADIGPLPILPGHPYSALYMEASMRPGMKSTVHRHSGPEVWYTLQGETCLETPQRMQFGRAGGPPVIVPAGVPMELTATGTVERRSLVLILHDATQPPTTPEVAWLPRGLCQR